MRRTIRLVVINAPSHTGSVVTLAIRHANGQSTDNDSNTTQNTTVFIVQAGSLPCLAVRNSLRKARAGSCA